MSRSRTYRGRHGEVGLVEFGHYCVSVLQLTAAGMTVLYSLIRYGDAVLELDHGIGTILDTVRRLGLASDTLAVFSSDNGAATRNSVNGNISVLSQCLLHVLHHCHLSQIVALLSIHSPQHLCVILYHNIHCG